MIKKIILILMIFGTLFTNSLTIYGASDTYTKSSTEYFTKDKVNGLQPVSNVPTVVNFDFETPSAPIGGNPVFDPDYVPGWSNFKTPESNFSEDDSWYGIVPDPTNAANNGLLIKLHGAYKDSGVVSHLYPANAGLAYNVNLNYMQLEQTTNNFSSPPTLEARLLMQLNFYDKDGNYISVPELAVLRPTIGKYNTWINVNFTRVAPANTKYVAAAIWTNRNHPAKEGLILDDVKLSFPAQQSISKPELKVDDLANPGKYITVGKLQSGVQMYATVPFTNTYINKKIIVVAALYDKTTNMVEQIVAGDDAILQTATGSVIIPLTMPEKVDDKYMMIMVWEKTDKGIVPYISSQRIDG